LQHLAQGKSGIYLAGIKFIYTMLNQKSIPIPAEIADIEINKYSVLKNEGAAILLNQFKGDAEKVTFHNSTFNSFVFERKDVLRFFLDDKDILDEVPDGKAQLLMVIFGAHPGVDAITDEEFKLHEAQFEKGSPTVIVAGVNFNPDQSDPEKQITLLNSSKPALEYPPGRTITKLVFDHDDNMNKLVFNFALK
jgi:hypothetical protein